MLDKETNKDDLTLKLQERVKELTCLYRISRIAREHRDSLDEMINQILKEIPEGWQYPAFLDVSIKLLDKNYGNARKKGHFQKMPLAIDGKEAGEIIISYKEHIDTNNIVPFLKEEQDLIEQIGHEIEAIVALYQKNQQEKKMNDQLRRNDRLNLLGEITAGIAHELNTPLGNILGYAELMQTQDKKNADLGKIIKSTLHARHIVKKLMFFSCDMPSQFKMTQINALILENIDLLHLQLAEANVHIDFNLEENLPQVKVDAIQFSQVLFNLILNAIAAMPNGGPISIKTTHTKKYISLKIKDSGTGIDPKNMQKIFEPFYSTKEAGSGTGLGLAVTYGIVQAHQGEISVISNLGEGTEFTIQLKLNKDA
ncbi:sensor histidine kinase [Crocinitomix catalasitica]|uniref:sensor histidine kinase n=1 Tax=Crocinitomix catalasitica TaxID=184607 RepID=UPI00048065BE|nr:ATP-binding protein [Crocinitomix catalasitica]